MIGSCVDRRKFLRLGAVVGVLVAGGCGGDDAPKEVTGPNLKKGNIEKIGKLKDKAAEKAAKK